MDFTNGPAMPIPTGNSNADSSGAGSSSNANSGETSNSPADLQPGHTGRVVGVVLTVVFCVLILAGFATWFVLRLRRRRRKRQQTQSVKAAEIVHAGGDEDGTALSPLEEGRISGLARPVPLGRTEHAPQYSWDFVDANPETKVKSFSQHSHNSASETKHDHDDDNDEADVDDARPSLTAPPGVDPPAYSRPSSPPPPQHAGEGHEDRGGRARTGSEERAREHVSS